MSRLRVTPLFASGALASTLACLATGDSGLGVFTGPSASDTVVTTSISAIGGDEQTAVAGTTLPNPLVVRVRGAASQPLPGVTVRWTVTQGGGSLGSDTTGTDDQGQASNAFTLGDSAGIQAVVAAVQADTTIRVTFTATATAVAATAAVRK